MRKIELLIITGCAIVAILSNRLRPDLVALLVLLALGLGGIVTPEQALAGFSRPAVLTIVELFVITATLERTGVVQWIATSLAYLSGRGEGRMIAVFMGAGALLSLVMNNIAAGAVLLPAAVNVACQARVRESRLLMNLILMQAGYPPALLLQEWRLAYLEALSVADTGRFGPLANLIGRAVEQGLDLYLEACEHTPVPEEAGEQLLSELAREFGYSTDYLSLLIRI